MSSNQPTNFSSSSVSATIFPHVREASAKLIFLTVFRGHWCPFCMYYLKSLQQIKGQIEAQSGKIVAVTAEPEAELPNTRKASGYDGEVIVDVHNNLAQKLKRYGLLDVAI